MKEEKRYCVENSSILLSSCPEDLWLFTWLANFYGLTVLSTSWVFSLTCFGLSFLGTFVWHESQYVFTHILNY